MKRIGLSLIILVTAFVSSVFAAANFLYHEQTANFIATPTCPSGGTDASCGRYAENTDRSGAVGFQIYSTETYNGHFKIEFQFFTNQLRVYYTTDGSNPSGSFGTPFGTTQVASVTASCTYSDQTQGCQIVDVGSFTLPVQAVGTTVKYIVSAWHSGGGPEVFGNSGTCSGCFSCTDSTTGCATVFQYNVIAAPTAAPATISGIVVTPDGAPLGGVTMRLSGLESATTITDRNGHYSFDNVDTEAFYSVTPARVNYHFNPVNRSFSLLGNVTDAVFTAIPDGVMVGNAIDSSEFFVRQHYLDFLGREPDQSGFNFWNDQVASCGDDMSCTERKRINVSAAYFLSIEFQATGGLVDGLYRISYGRRPNYAEFVPDCALIAKNVVLGQGNWEQELTANKRAFVQLFVSRQAFRDRYEKMTNASYLDELISHAGVSLTEIERQTLLSRLNSGTSTRAEILSEIVENDEFVQEKRNQAFVLMQYFGYLRRDPDESGYQFWLTKLNQFDGDFERAEMVKAFLDSSEYRARFAN